MEEIKIIKTDNSTIDLSKLSYDNLESNLSNILSLIDDTLIDETILLPFLIKSYEMMGDELGKIPNITELIIKKAVSVANEFGMTPILDGKISVYFDKRIHTPDRIIASGEEVSVKEAILYNGAKISLEDAYHIAKGVQQQALRTPAYTAKYNVAVGKINDIGEMVETYFTPAYAKKINDVETALKVSIPTTGEGDASSVLINFLHATRDNPSKSIKSISDNQLFITAVWEIMTGNIDNILPDILSRAKNAGAEFAVQQEVLSKQRLSTEYIAIIREVLGTAEYDTVASAIEKKPFLINTPNAILDLVSKHKKMIQDTADRRQKLIDEISKGVPYMLDLAKIRKSPINERPELLNEFLAKYGADPSLGRASSVSQDDIKKATSKQHGELVCPHVAFLIHHYKDTKDDIKAGLSSFLGKSDGRMFCTNCGEVITVIEAHDSKLQDFDNNIMTASDAPDDPLYAEMLSHIGRVFINFEIKNASDRDTIEFMIQIRESIYPFLRDVSKSIQKIKTSQPGAYDAQMNVYIAIYIYAYLLRYITDMMAKNRNSIQIQLASDPQARDLKKLARGFVGILMSTHERYISKMAGASPQVLATKMVQAYGKLSVGIKLARTRKDAKGQLQSAIANVVIDPYFKFLRMSSIGMSASAVLGFDLKDEKALPSDIYSKAKIAKDADADAKLLYDWMQERGFEDPVFSNVIHIPDFDTIHGHLADKEKAWRKRLTDNGYIQRNKRLNLLTPWELVSNYRYKDTFAGISRYNAEQSLLRIFNKDGTPRKWNRWKTKDGKLLTIGDIKDAIMAGKWMPTKVEGIADESGTLKSTLHDKKEEGLIEKILDLYTLNDFLRFYENRCPEGNQHEYAGDKCKKCGKKVSSNDNNIAYFNKYKSKYFDEKNKAHEYSISRIISHFSSEEDIGRTAIPKSIAEQYKNWTANYSILTDVAKKADINPSMIMAFGAYEGIEASLIEQGKYVPPEPESGNSPRIYNVLAILQTLYAHYKLLRESITARNLPVYIGKLVEGIVPRSLQEMLKVLPDLKKDIYPVITYFQHEKTGKETIDFLLITLMTNLGKIWNDTNTGNKKIRHEFVKSFLKYIIENEKRVSKPGYFSWEMVYGRDGNPAEEAGQAQAELELGNYQNKNITEAINEGEAEFADDKYSLDAYDMEQGDGEDGLGDNDFAVEGM